MISKEDSFKRVLLLTDSSGYQIYIDLPGKYHNTEQSKEKSFTAKGNENCSSVVSHPHKCAAVDVDQGPNPSAGRTCEIGTPRKHKVSIGIKSISADKMLNTDDLKIVNKVISRASSKNVGMSKPVTNFEEPSGFEIQDFSLLQQCLETSAIHSKM